MTNPQDIPTDEIQVPAVEGGILYRFLTKMIAWTVFIGCLAMMIGTAIFIALALYRGIIWLWPVTAA
jgi:hypothetical protein